MLFFTKNTMKKKIENKNILEHSQSIIQDVPGIIFRFTLSTDDKWGFEFLEGNSNFLELLGIHPQDIIANPNAALNLLPPDEQIRLNTALYHSAKMTTPFAWTGEFKTPEGNCWLQFNAIPQKRADGSICWSGLSMDVSEGRKQQIQIQELNQQLKQQVDTDFLTGLSNRRKFCCIVEQEMRRFSRSGTPLCLAILDLDKFKLINDTYGHDFGDKVLKHFAQVLSTTVRLSDTPARIGGEEFAIVLPDTSKEQGVNICTRVLKAEKTFDDEGNRLSYTCSIGLTEIHSDDDFTSLFSRADEMMYLAKERGRNCLES